MSSDSFTTPQTMGSEGPRLGGFLARHPVLVDVTVAVLYVFVMLPGLMHGLIYSAGASTAQAGIGLAATLSAGLALAFRRRAPIVVLAAVLVLVLIGKTIVFGLTDPLGIAIAGYAAAAYQPQRRAWLTVTSGIAVVVLGILIGAPLSPHALPVDALLILNLALFIPSCLLGLLVSIRARLRRAEELRVLHEMQEQAHAAKLSAVQQRAVLSREMHDVVGHSLTAIINLSDGALRAGSASPETLESGLQRINTIARDALGETRTILGTLRPEGETAPRAPAGRPSETPTHAGLQRTETLEPDADLGLHELLATAEDTGLTTRLTVTGEPVSGTLSNEARTAVYRIVQEAITNTMRHASGATRLSVTLTYSQESLMAQIHDDGQAAPSTVALGNGLKGATERATLLGGTLHAGPAPAGGWHVTATIPTNPESTS